MMMFPSTVLYGTPDDPGGSAKSGSKKKAKKKTAKKKAAKK